MSQFQKNPKKPKKYRNAILNFLVIGIFWMITPLSGLPFSSALAKDPLTIVYNPGVAPLKFEDRDQRVMGFFPDIWQLWAEKNGRAIRFVRAGSFEESLELLKQGTVDLHAGLFKTAERERHLDYSAPILELDYFIFTHMSIYPMKSLADASGFLVGITKGGYTEKYVRSVISSEHIVIHDSYTSLFKAALEGDIKVFVTTKLSLLYYLNENYIPNIFEFHEDRPLYTQTYHTATAKGNIQLISQVNHGFKAISNPERIKLEEKWIVKENSAFFRNASGEDQDEKQKDPVTAQKPLKAISKERSVESYGDIVVSKNESSLSGMGQILLYGIIIFIVLGLIIWILIRNIKSETVALHFGSRWFRIIVLGVLTLFVFFVCHMGVVTLERNLIKIKADVGNSLKGVIQTAEKRMELWLEQRRAFIKQLGQNPELVALTKALLKIPADREQLLSSRIQRDTRLFFDNNKNIFPNSGFYIISSDNKILAAGKDVKLGKTDPVSVCNPHIIKRVFDGEAILAPPIHSPAMEGEPSSFLSKKTQGSSPPDPNDGQKRHCFDMFFMAPIQGVNGEVIAIMALKVAPVRDFSRIFQFFWMGNTGETFAFEQHGRMLSQSRYADWFRKMEKMSNEPIVLGSPEILKPSLDNPAPYGGKNGLLNLEIRSPGGNLTKGYIPADSRDKWPLTVMVKSALKLKQSMEAAGNKNATSPVLIHTGGYRDYRGVPVFGAWLWNADLGMGIATEIDVEEALSAYSMMKWTVFGMLGFTLVFSVGATLFVLIVGERTNRALLKARDNLEEKVLQRTRDLRKNQERLKSAEEQTRLILNSAGEGIFGVDAMGICTFANPAALEMLAYNLEGILGRSIHELIHHSHGDATPYPVEDCPMSGAYLNGRTETVSDEILWKSDGTAFPVEYTATPVIRDEIVTGAVITFRDITERNKMEERLRAEREKLQQILDASPIGVSISSGDIIRFLNPRVSQLTGLQSGDPISQINLVDPEQRMKALKMLEETNSIEENEIQVYDPQGQMRNLMVTYMHTQYNGGPAYLSWIVDITEMKKAENKLRDKFDELARFRRMAVGRELKMIQLKKEINDFLKASGKGARYEIVSPKKTGVSPKGRRKQIEFTMLMPSCNDLSRYI